MKDKEILIEPLTGAKYTIDPRLDEVKSRLTSGIVEELRKTTFIFKDRIPMNQTQIKPYEGVNWNTPTDGYTLAFWEQNIKQFWIDTEYIPSKDIDSWKGLSPEMRLAYKRALAGLTMLDTLQSSKGMNKIIEHLNDAQKEAVLAFMGAMEAIHAKSYSTIFTTVASTDEINEIFEWVKANPYLQTKAKEIDDLYQNIKPGDDVSLYQALAGSVLLESFLFYSGFFLPLWLAGQGEMVASSDIIKKIIADESIHGSYVGMIAQEVYDRMTPEQQLFVTFDFNTRLERLLQNEYKYSEQLYTDIGRTSEVKEYLRYNANKAKMNLGFPEMFPDVKVNQIVLNGLNTETTQHDFFSKKSTNYEKATEIVHLVSDDFCVENM